MTTHTSRTYLNSCLKVPIDPCNNCPAPIYNRPKMYLGRLTGTPISITTTKYTTARTRQVTTDNETENETLWACSGVRSLAKLYDSIPDYCDLNHLEEDEFYSTLDTLRTACHELKTKLSPAPVCSMGTRPNSSSQSTSSTTSSGQKEKKSASKKKSSSTRRKAAAVSKTIPKEQITLDTSWGLRETPCDVVGYKKSTYTRSSRPKDYKKECADEVAAFKRTLREFEEELSRSTYIDAPSRPKSTTLTCRDRSATNLTRIAEDTGEDGEKSARVPKDSVRCMRDRLKKSFSFNDIHSIGDSDESTRARLQAGIADKLTKSTPLFIKDRTKLSNYFVQKPTKEQTKTEAPKNDLPGIVIETPSSETMSSKPSSTSSRVGQRKKSRSKKLPENFAVPFSIFDLNSSKKEHTKNTSASPSPQHPVARPNLAATLRVEVSKKKVKELQTNCTYNDTTPQVDWEVRKTPAWKSLSLNETHKQILALRLATRKAEQELQKREYNLNMELMRQRVKSAPLLLEGQTYWGPNVGKLSHTCQMEGVKHLCQGNLRKQRKKSGASSRRYGSDCGGAGGRVSSKFHSLRKIYANSAASGSRQSHRSDGHGKKRSSRPIKTAVETNDSGDDLCSVDRAYL